MIVDFFWNSRNAYVMGIKFKFLAIENNFDRDNALKTNEDYRDAYNGGKWCRLFIKREHWDLIHDIPTLVSKICSDEMKERCNYIIHFDGVFKYEIEWIDDEFKQKYQKNIMIGLKNPL